MLDINLIRENPGKVKQGLEKRNLNPALVDDFLAVDEEWRSAVAKIDELRKEQNELTEKLSKKQDKELIEKARELKEKINELEVEKDTLDKKRAELLYSLPNLPFPDVPVGKDEKDNKVLREIGEKREFDFEPKDHLTIAENLGLIDVKKSGEVSGSRFGYILGDAVLLEFALVKLAFDILIKDGFVPVVPPVMIKPEVYGGMGRLAGDQKEERYYLEKDNLYLVGSSEHTLGPIHINDILTVDTLPRRYVGFSTCFRREAGSYGKDTKGILRVHQFDKVEMFVFTEPEHSDSEHKFLLSVQEKLVKLLKLPYQVIEICTGDIGWTDAKQYDIEIWLPAQPSITGRGLGIYRETHSCSNTTDFQARGVNVKYKKNSGKPEYLHMLNATAFAIGRMLIAIIENYQTKDGFVEVPEVLRNYVGKDIIK